MGYIGKIEEKIKAQTFRKKGLSYNEILKHVTVSKDTLSRWCRDIKLTKAQQNRLMKNKLTGQKKGSLIAAENKRKLRINRTKKIFKLAKKHIGSLSKRDRFMIGIALYAGEGSKTDGQGGFSNSDPSLIGFMSKWFQEFCKIPLSKLKGAIWLHQGLSVINAIEFWSKVSDIPKKQFYKTYISGNDSKAKKNIHNYGVFGIRFSNSEKHREIMGWILASLGGKIPSRYF